MILLLAAAAFTELAVSASLEVAVSASLVLSTGVLPGSGFGGRLAACLFMHAVSFSRDTHPLVTQEKGSVKLGRGGIERS